MAQPQLKTKVTAAKGKLKRPRRSVASRPNDPIDGVRLRARRLALGIGQDDLVGPLNRTKNTICRWELGGIKIDHPDHIDFLISKLEQEGVTPKQSPIDGERLKARREALCMRVGAIRVKGEDDKPLSQAQLGELLDTPASTIVRWERRKMSVGDANWLAWKMDQIEAGARSSG